MGEPGRIDDTTEQASLLLVDDDAIFCKVLMQALEKRGFQVQVAYSLKASSAILATTQPSFAIIDLRIGAESGLELVKQVKAVNPNAHIVMLTGYASIATAVEAIKLGATHYLTKPADVDEIIKALQKIEGDSGAPLTERPLSVRRLEWEHLQKVLMEHDGNISAAARALGMHRRTLQRKLDKRPVRD